MGMESTYAYASRFMVCLKSTFENHENAAMSAAILTKSDVMNTSGVCGSSVLYITSQPFFAVQLQLCKLSHT